MQNDFLNELTARIDAVSGNAEKEFGNLSAAQLNWKPSEDSWSIAQCLDHIIVSNETYFPQLETVISGRWKNSFWQNMPLLPKFWGRKIIKTVSPNGGMKVKTFKIFKPASSGIPAAIIKEFVSHNHTLKKFFEKSSYANHDRIVITFPVSKFITYTLRDAFILLTAHEEKHYLQAIHVKETAEFPA